MGFLRKAAIYGTGGLARVVIKPNSDVVRSGLSGAVCLNNRSGPAARRAQRPCIDAR
jgi:hypothetical protein